MHTHGLHATELIHLLKNSILLLLLRLAIAIASLCMKYEFEISGIVERAEHTQVVTILIENIYKCADGYLCVERKKRSKLDSADRYKLNHLILYIYFVHCQHVNVYKSIKNIAYCSIFIFITILFLLLSLNPGFVVISVHPVCGVVWCCFFIHIFLWATVLCEGGDSVIKKNEILLCFSYFRFNSIFFFFALHDFAERNKRLEFFLSWIFIFLCGILNDLLFD